MQILLVEPDYKNKYPPLGLMKISTYHKQIGDNVVFCKGKNKELKEKKWDRIYISSLFTFYWKKTVDTIEYYLNSVKKPKDIYCGGVLATLKKDELLSLYDITVLSGLINKSGILGSNDIIVDHLPPDYSIVDTALNEYLEYTYPTNDSYIGYSTRGCIRKCGFCAVPIIEPDFVSYIDIKKQVNYIKENYGEKKNLLLLDNNVLASKEFDRIIDDIKELGFYKGAKFKYKKNNRNISVNRYVDFNQGVDARLLTKEKCLKLSEIAIKPLRIAFDSADEEMVKVYVNSVRLAAECKIEHLSNYLLFNCNDEPKDFYNRLKINVKLNQEFETKGLKTRIWSFPMKYSPIIGENSKDRKFIGEKWNKKYLRAIQCVLAATHGVVGPKMDFFEKAFGASLEDFFIILSLPENYIIYREKYEKNGLSGKWYKDFVKLDKQGEIYDFIMAGNFQKSEVLKEEALLKHYIV